MTDPQIISALGIACIAAGVAVLIIGLWPTRKTRKPPPPQRHICTTCGGDCRQAPGGSVCTICKRTWPPLIVDDLPPTRSIHGVRVRIPDSIPDSDLNAIGLATRDVRIISAWGKGVWLATHSGSTGRRYPLSMERPMDVLKWKLLDHH